MENHSFFCQIDGLYDSAHIQYYIQEITTIRGFSIMPTYKYECAACKHGFEVFQSMADAPLTICPVCGQKVRRIIGGGTGIIFKGSGFYVNDSRKSDSGSDSGSPKASPPDSTVKKEAV